MNEKIYVFKHGKVKGDFNAKQLKEFERLLGSFYGVVVNHRMIKVDNVQEDK